MNQSPKAVFVVIGEYGEYEQRGEVLCGVFESLEQAEEAITQADLRRAADWQRYEDWDAKRKAELASFTPTTVMKGSCFPGGEHLSYEDAAYVEAKRRAGLQPDLNAAFDTIYIYAVKLGEYRGEHHDAVKTIECKTDE